MFRKTKFYVAVALIAQAVASLVTFIVLAAKKKSHAAAFLAVGGVSGAAGAYLMCECIDEERALEEYCDGDCENCDEKEGIYEPAGRGTPPPGTKDYQCL